MPNLHVELERNPASLRRSNFILEIFTVRIGRSTPFSFPLFIFRHTHQFGLRNPHKKAGPISTHRDVTEIMCQLSRQRCHSQILSTSVFIENMSFIRRIFTKVCIFEIQGVKIQSLFKAPEQKDNEDYETILSTLANDIQKRQLKLSELRLRERRSTLLATLYTLGAWVAYVGVWHWDSLPMKISNPRVAKGVKVLPVLFGPIVCVYSSSLFSFTPNSQIQNFIHPTNCSNLVSEKRRR